MNNSQLAADSFGLVPSSETDGLMVTQILSLTPGRIRLRVDLSGHSREEVNLMVVSLDNHLAIEKVRINIEIGSLTIFYDSQSINTVEIIDELKKLGLTFSEKSITSSPVIPSSSKTAIHINQMGNNVNQVIKQGSNNIVDLGVIVPLGFALLAWRQLILKGWQLETIPWYVLAWYAFDSFIKLQNTQQNSQDI
ncbi:MAG: HMA2 domain-containing protein [Crocosphaera sp.]